jgi:hypothetical protein
MPQRVQARILGDRLAVLPCLGDASGNLRRLQAALDDGGTMLDVAAAIREHEVAVVAPTSESVLAQAGDNHGR